MGIKNSFGESIDGQVLCIQDLSLSLFNQTTAERYCGLTDTLTGLQYDFVIKHIAEYSIEKIISLKTIKNFAHDLNDFGVTTYKGEELYEVYVGKVVDELHGKIRPEVQAHLENILSDRCDTSQLNYRVQQLLIIRLWVDQLYTQFSANNIRITRRGETATLDFEVLEDVFQYSSEEEM